MAGVTDFIDPEGIVDTVLSELAAHLPAKWTDRSDLRWSLKALEFGDYRDFVLPPDPVTGEPGTWRDYTPAILVTQGHAMGEAEFSGEGGHQAVGEALSVVYLFGEDHCRDKTTDARIQPARARAQRAKIICRALFDDVQRRLGSPILSCADTGFAIRVWNVTFNGVVYPPGYVEELADHHIYGLAINITVHTRAQ
jgi:hypothetical protein